MKSIHQLHYTFPAGLSQAKWHKLNIEYDAAKGFESFVHCECVVNQKPGATYAFWSQSNAKKKHNSTTFRYTGESSGSVMSLMTMDRVLHICQSHLAILSGEAILSCCDRIRDTRSQICCNAAASAGIWSKFWCAGESSAYVFSRVMTAPAQHICQSHLALRPTRWYWVLQFEHETRLTHSRQTRSFWWYLIEVQVHRKGSNPYPYKQSIPAYLPITVAIYLV